MEFNFACVGVIDKGAVREGDVTVICAPNNMGKIYISYAIYDLLHHLKQQVDMSVSRDILTKLVYGVVND